MSIEEARKSKIRESLRLKYLQNDTSNPLGRYKLLLTDYHKGDPFLTLGPNYLIFAISFVIINFFSLILLHKLSKNDITHTYFLILTVVIIFLDTIWLATALINPGISLSNSEQQGQICQLCQANNRIQIIKKIDRFHCQQCDICIDEQESHLKLIGGCVGKSNFIVFKLLLLAIFLWGLTMITIVPLTYNLQ